MSTVRIPLTRGKFAVIDEADLPLVSQYKWGASGPQRGGRWYAVTQRRGTREIRMHRLIMNAPDGVLVDHRDGDGLNNRRENLRFATNRDNILNVGSAPSNSTTGVLNVSFDKQTQTYAVRINHTYYGRYKTLEEAAVIAYQKRQEVFGPIAVARLSQPPAVTSEIKTVDELRAREVTLNGRTQRLFEWAQETGLNFGTINSRIKRGWSVEEALLTPRVGYPRHNWRQMGGAA